MKSRLVVAGLCALLVSGGYVFAGEGHDHGDDKGSMMDHDSMMGEKGSMTGHEGMMNEDMNGEKSAQAVEVGNKICPVSGDRIDSGKMGEAVKYEYNGKIYNLCCDMCIKDFKKDPEKYSKIAEEEVRKSEEHKEGNGHERHNHGK